jgi:hypothetical protein
MTQEDKIAAYREAYADWQKQLADLHFVLLDGNRLDPVRLKGLLNREARAKRRYDIARNHLLGIEDDSAPLDDDEEGEDED